MEDIDEAGMIKCSKISDPSECLNIVTQHGKFTVLTVNIRSINCNFDILIAFLSKFNTKIDIIVLTECWTNNNYNPPVINNYNIFQTKINLNQNDGVVVYVCDGIHDIVTSEPECSEGNCIVLEIKEKYSIICTYRPPCFKNTLNYINSLDRILNKYSNKSNVIFTGDVNLDTLNQNNNGHTSIYLNLLATYGLRPGVTCPTRLTSCLDHFMIKSTSKVQTFVFDELTDHSPILLCIDYPTPKFYPIPHYTTKIDFSGLNRTLATICWNELYEITDVNKAAEIINLKIEECIAQNTVLKKISKRKLPLKPWLTPGIVRSIRKRRKLFNSHKKNLNNELLKIIYINYRNTLNKLIKNLKKNYYKEQLLKHRGNLRETWNTIKELCNIQQSKTSAEALLKLKSSPVDSLNTVNHFFTSIGSDLASTTLDRLNVNVETLSKRAKRYNGLLQSMTLHFTDESEVTQTISNLNTNSAPGFDRISTKILKLNNLALSKPLAYLINLSFEQGRFPKIYKNAITCPIHKTGDKNLVTNYRPISLLSAVSKVIEKISNKRLIKLPGRKTAP